MHKLHDRPLCRKEAPEHPAGTRRSVNVSMNGPKVQTDPNAVDRDATKWRLLAQDVATDGDASRRKYALVCTTIATVCHIINTSEYGGKRTCSVFIVS